MSAISISSIQEAVMRVLVSLMAAVVFLGLLLSVLWRDREKIEDIPIPPITAATGQERVAATWLGVSTLLIDDGETQLLIDGFISRPNLVDILLNRPVDNDAATINHVLNHYRIDRLAAIIPVHSHFDHAMDIGAIANRSSASILGSESTARISRGARVPEDQVVVVNGSAEYQFGEFMVRLVESRHAPVGWRGSIPIPGTIDKPLSLPAPITAFRAGDSYSVLITHPEGTTLVQGSAGIREGALADFHADTVFLGVGLIEGLGQQYVSNYWQHTITATGAKLVIPVHFDDYSRPFGTVELMPRSIDNFRITAEWLIENRNKWDQDTRLYLPEFGVPFALYPGADPEA
ncbi:MAG: MBL fold metallo-hydrolase [Woeseiaceae bacterium]|nr:MBL fold metallo-hydrolase [Woeseiaceae bacterium]